MELPDIRDLLPHSGPMVLLDQVVAADDESLCAAVRVREDSLFYADGAVGLIMGHCPARRHPCIFFHNLPVGFSVARRHTGHRTGMGKAGYHDKTPVTVFFKVGKVITVDRLGDTAPAHYFPVKKSADRAVGV